MSDEAATNLVERLRNTGPQKRMVEYFDADPAMETVTVLPSWVDAHLAADRIEELESEVAELRWMREGLEK